MTKKNISETNFTSNKVRKRISHKKSMPTIRCVCGLEILVVPDLKAMNQAIKKHIAEHKQLGCGQEGLQTLDSLTEFLTEQVIIVASKINLPSTN